MASEREGLWGSPARQRSIASLKSRPHRKDRTGSCPVLGRPRFFRTTFESDMRRVLQQSAHTGNPSLRKPSPCILSCRRLSHCRAARQAPCDSENVTWLSEKRYVAFSAGLRKPSPCILSFLPLGPAGSVR